MIGSILSLITQSQFRYQGKLVKLDTDEKAIHMSKVKSFGTEGRRGDNEVPPNPKEIESVILKLDHIRDFKVVAQEELDGTKLSVPAA